MHMLYFYFVLQTSSDTLIRENKMSPDSSTSPGMEWGKSSSGFSQKYWGKSGDGNLQFSEGV